MTAERSPLLIDPSIMATDRKTAYQRVRELHEQIGKGCTIAPAVHVILLKELHDEHTALLSELEQLRSAKKAAK